MISRRAVTAYPQIIRTLFKCYDYSGSRQALEQLIAEKWQVKAARLISSCRAGLEWLLAFARSKGQQVCYVPAFTIPAIPKIVERLGYKLRFLDIDPETISVTEDVIKRAYVGPGVVIVTHYFGLPADMPSIMRLADQLDLLVVEDCAHAPGARVLGKSVGSFGLGGAFSFETRKLINTLGGGCLVSSHPEVTPVLMALQAPRTPLHQDVFRLVFAGLEWASLKKPLFSLVGRMLHFKAGKSLALTVYRGGHSIGREMMLLSDFRARIARDQVVSLQERVEKRRKLARLYDSYLPKDIIKPLWDPNRPHQYFVYAAQHEKATELGLFLRRRGVDCGIGDEVLQHLGDKVDTPGTAKVVSRILELPMHDNLSEEDVVKVCSVAHLFR